jgi:uncharacterized protein (DUF488 family)
MRCKKPPMTSSPPQQVPSDPLGEKSIAVLYTIGHSTRSIEELIAALQAHGVQTLVDIRAFPMSRRLPQFNRETLEASLPSVGIRYEWMKSLGGYRKKILDESPNIALRSESFRNYAITCSLPSSKKLSQP